MEITLSQVAMAWAAFSEIANRPGPVPGQIKVFHAYLVKKLSAEEFAAACQLWSLKSCYLPAPAQLVELVLPSAKEIALEDWTKILAASSNCAQGTNGLTEIGEKALIAVGGLYAVSKNPGMVRSAFFDFHETLQRKEEREEAIAQLTGDKKALAPVDTELLRQRIGEQMIRTGKNGILPSELQQKTGKKFVSDLDCAGLEQYLEELKALPDAEAVRYAS